MPQLFVRDIELLMMYRNNDTPDNKLDTSDYAAIREALEDNPHDIVYPFSITHHFAPHTHDLLTKELDASEFTWVDDKHGNSFITIRSEFEAWQYVHFAEHNDYLCSARKADAMIAAVKKAKRANFFRRLAFMRLAPVADIILDREKLIRSLMKG